ncbi:CHY zinc finger protein [Clavibacter sp. VKM Ac-2872]|uniref:CHY zinc finger protein n=1 Tax=Clavibacter sp. VKM Ac-2872 TaxID=2783812 RepID=UPI00351B44D9
MTPSDAAAPASTPGTADPGVVSAIAGHGRMPVSAGDAQVTGSAGHVTAAGTRDVRGPAVDAETRCVHYGSALDVVALRAPCCDAWYPCHLCHAAVADHPLEVIPRSAHHLPAALCGVCRATMTVSEYLAADACPSCGAAFNPGCAAHAHLYFAQ